MKKRGLKIIFAILFLVLIGISSAQPTVIYDDSNIPRINFEGVGKAIKTFISLIDTPASYAGEGGNCVAVNGAEDGLEFIACGVGGEGGNTTAEIRNAVNASVEYDFTANNSNWWGGVTSFATDWLTNIGDVLTFNETKLIDMVVSNTSDIYVNVTGDTMTGPLNMSNTNITLTNTSIVDAVNRRMRFHIENGSWVVAI